MTQEQQEQIDTISTISIRYHKLHYTAEEAERAIRKLNAELFPDFITKEEIDVLENARNIMLKIFGKTNQSDAIKYYNELKK
jgi:hypothetical protein